MVEVEEVNLYRLNSEQYQLLSKRVPAEFLGIFNAGGIPPLGDSWLIEKEYADLLPGIGRTFYPSIIYEGLKITNLNTLAIDEIIEYGNSYYWLLNLVADRAYVSGSVHSKRTLTDKLLATEERPEVEQLDGILRQIRQQEEWYNEYPNKAAVAEYHIQKRAELLSMYEGLFNKFRKDNS
jgi:hypothetical protein